MINVQEREKAHQSARIGILFATFEARSRAKMKTTKIIKMLSTGLALASIGTRIDRLYCTSGYGNGA
jgi:hypothetical protein